MIAFGPEVEPIYSLQGLEAIQLPIKHSFTLLTTLVTLTLENIGTGTINIYLRNLIMFYIIAHFSPLLATNFSYSSTSLRYEIGGH